MTPLQPPEPGRWKALSLTVLVHVVLLAVLFIGITPNQVSKEASDLVVDLVRPSSSPPPPAPVPPPEAKPEPRPPPPPPVKVEPRPQRSPDIAVKQEPRKEPQKKVETPKPEPRKNEPIKPEPPKPVPEPPRPQLSDLQKQLQQEMLAQRASVEQQAAAREAAQMRAARATKSWLDRIGSKVRSNNLFETGGLRGNPVAEFVVTLLPDGSVLNVRLRKPSGIQAWDEASERAIRKSSPFPKPDDPSAFQRELALELCPKPNVDNSCH